MPTYLTPGVYVEEVPSASKPVEGVGTSVAAFFGLAPGGPENRPMRISNWSQFARTYGDPVEPENGPFMPDAYLAHAVYGFFHNGGKLCWVVRVNQNVGAPAQSALPAAGDEGREAFRAIAQEGVEGDVSVEISEEVAPPTKEGEDDGGTEATDRQPTYRIVVKAKGAEPEVHANLTASGKGPKSFLRRVNSASKLISLELKDDDLPEAMRVPAPGTYQLTRSASATEELSASSFEGDVARREGMGSIAALDEVNTLCAPDLMALLRNGDDSHVRDLQGKMIAHCENAGTRMAILDSPPGMLPQDVLDWRNAKAGFDSKFAALYYPWAEVRDPLTNESITVPPCGHVAGMWARTDGGRGVHKAPANEALLGVNGVAFQVTGPEQAQMNKLGINCIRSFPARGIRVWGARTLSSDPEWRYLNVRRLFNYIVESIIQGTQWAVFEPNDERLWRQLRIAASNFLTRTWREGALFGATPDQAFFVICNEETNPPDVVDAGQVVVEIGLAPVKPAEFVIFRISQYAAGTAEVTA